MPLSPPQVLSDRQLTAIRDNTGRFAYEWAQAAALGQPSLVIDKKVFPTEETGNAIRYVLANTPAPQTEQLLGLSFDNMEFPAMAEYVREVAPHATILTEAFVYAASVHDKNFLDRLGVDDRATQKLLQNPPEHLSRFLPWLAAAEKAISDLQTHLPNEIQHQPEIVIQLPRSWEVSAHSTELAQQIHNLVPPIDGPRWVPIKRIDGTNDRSEYLANLRKTNITSAEFLALNEGRDRSDALLRIQFLEDELQRLDQAIAGKELAVEELPASVSMTDHQRKQLAKLQSNPRSYQPPEGSIDRRSNWMKLACGGVALLGASAVFPPLAATIMEFVGAASANGTLTAISISVMVTGLGAALSGFAGELKSSDQTRRPCRPTRQSRALSRLKSEIGLNSQTLAAERRGVERMLAQAKEIIARQAVADDVAVIDHQQNATSKTINDVLNRRRILGSSVEPSGRPPQWQAYVDAVVSLELDRVDGDGSFTVSAPTTQAISALDMERRKALEEAAPPPKRLWQRVRDVVTTETHSGPTESRSVPPNGMGL